MKVTPLEIRQKDFNKVFRGYDKEEVDAYLKSLSKEWERVLEDHAQVSKKLEYAEREVSRLRDVEASLLTTIKSAESTGANMIEHAQRQSDLYLRESRINAEAMLTDARTKAKALLEEAEEEAQGIVADLKSGIQSLELQYRDLLHRKEHILRELTSFGESLLERVQIEKSKSDEATMEERWQQVTAKTKKIKTDAPPVVERTGTFNFESAKEIAPTVKEIVQPGTSEAAKPAVEKTVQENTPTNTEKKNTSNDSGSFFDTL